MRGQPGQQGRRAALAALALSMGVGTLALAEDDGAGTGAALTPTSASSSLEAQLGARRAELAREEARKQQLTEARDRLPEARKALERTLVRDVRALYRLQRGGLLPMIGGVDAWVGHAARVAQLERMTTRALDALQRRGEEEAELARELEDNAGKLLASTRAVGALEHARAQRAQQEAVALRLAVTEASDSDRMHYGLSLSAASGAHTPFADERGALAPPVPFAGLDARAPSANTRWITLNAAPGTRVRAAATGRVTFADRHPRHGLLVIVDHGSGYRTLYGGLEAIDVEVGDTLGKSTALGTAGGGPLRFEVRHGAQRLDARAWLGT